MRASTWLVAMSGVLALVAAQAAAARAESAASSPHLNSQQQLMKSCSADAKSKGVSGADRQAFMSSCLKSKGVSEDDIAKLNKQQEKMKTCNADAKTKGLSGADRKAFMKSCLSSASG